MDTIILQTQSIDAEDGSRMWSAQWLLWGVAYPGPEFFEPNLEDPRTTPPPHE